MVAAWPYTGGMTKERIDEVKTNLRVSHDVLDAVRRLARLHERSLNSEIIVALREYAARHADDEQQSSKVAC